MAQQPEAENDFCQGFYDNLLYKLVWLLGMSSAPSSGSSGQYTRLFPSWLLEGQAKSLCYTSTAL